MASPAQQNLLNRLLVEKEIPAAGMFASNEGCRRVHDAIEGRSLDTRQASDAITFLLKMPNKPSTEPRGAVVEEEGVYVLDGTIIKMKRSKAGRLYAMKLVEIGGVRLTELGKRVKMEYEYAPQLTNLVRAEHKMTLEQAKAFGIRYGRCLRCNLTLKDATSVERAIGPVCIKWFEGR